MSRGSRSKTPPAPAIAAPSLPAPPADRWDFAAGGTIFAIALAARLLYVRDLAAAGLISYLRLDPLYYHEWALRIAAGDWAGGSAVYEMSPLYAYFLAAVYRTFGEGQIVPRLIQSALGAAVCGLLVVVGRRAFGKVEGVIAGAAFALYAPAIFYDGQVMKTSFEISFTALMTFAFFMASARGRPPLPRWTFVGGVLLGLTALMRENILVAAPLFFVWAIWPRRPNPWRRCLPSGAALVAGAVLAILPATIRNLVVAREAVLITSLGGENFYTGNNETAGGRYTPPPFIRPDPQYEHEDFRQEAARRLGRSLTRREASNYWYGEGLRFITSHPVAFFRLLADKFAVFWNDFERPDNFSIYNFKRFSPLLGAPLLHFAWIAPAGILGIALSARRWRDLVPFHVVIAAYLASALIFFTQSRYRAPVVPILALFAAHAATAIVHAALARDARTLAWALPALAGLVLFVTIGPGNTPLFDAQNHSLVAEMELESGRLREAADEYRACIAAVDRLSESGSTPARRVQAGARLGLGRTLLKLGDVQGAVQELTRAAESPREDVRYASLTMLGVLLAEGGNARGSAEALKRAVAERPDEFEARMLYAEALDRIGSRSEAIAQIEAALRIRPGDVEAARIREALRRDTASR